MGLSSPVVLVSNLNEEVRSIKHEMQNTSSHATVLFRSLVLLHLSMLLLQKATNGHSTTILQKAREVSVTLISVI